MADRPPPLPKSVKLLGAASFLNDVASEMIFPLLPRFLVTVLGGNRIQLGLIEGVAESVSSLLKLWSGAWSDRSTRRKQFVVGGYALAAIARPVLSVVTAPAQLFMARIADRIGKGIRTAPRDALIADITPPESRGRAFGFHRAMDHLGAALGPALAALYLWFWPEALRSLFLLTLLPGCLVIALLSIGLKNTPAPPSKSPAFEWTLRPFDTRFRKYLLVLLLFTLGNSSDTFLLLRASELGVPIAGLPLLWLTFHLAKSGGNLIMGPLVDRIGPRRPLIAGWLIYSGVYIAFALATQAWHAWIFFLMYAAYYALTESAEKTLVTELAGPDQRGLAFGWYNFVIGIAALPSSVLFGILYEQAGPLIAFGSGAALALLATALLATIPRS